MKAIVCEKYGPPSDLVLKDLPKLNPGDKEVVIQVKACSLNFPDTLIIQGKTNGNGQPPTNKRHIHSNNNSLSRFVAILSMD